MTTRLQRLCVFALTISVPPAALAQEDATAQPAVEADEGHEEDRSDTSRSPSAAPEAAESPVPAAPPNVPAAGDDFTPVEAPERVSAVSGGLTVIGSRRKREKQPSVHKVGEQQLERFNRDDPNAVLNQVPGVYTRQEDGIGLRPNIGARGVNPDRSKKMTLLEDDVLFGPAPYSAPAAYYFPLITRMTEVEVLKGAATLSHGPQTVAGAVNLRTREIPEQGWAAGLDVAGGEYVYGKAHGYVGSSWRNFGFLLEGVHLQTNGFKQLDGGGDTGFSRNEWMLKAQYILNPGADVQHTLKVKLGYSNENSNETYLGLTKEDFRRNPLRRYGASRFDNMTWDRTQVDLRHEVQASNLHIVTVAYRMDLERVWRRVQGFVNGPGILDVLRNPAGGQNAGYYLSLVDQVPEGFPVQQLAIGPNDRQFVSQGIQSRGRWATSMFGHRNEVTFEGRFHHDGMRRVHTEDKYAYQGGVLQLVPGQMTRTTADDSTRSLAWSLYLGDELELGKLTVRPAARLEAISTRLRDRRSSERLDNTTVTLLPGINAHYQLVRGLGVLAGVHRGFSPPSPRDQLGKPELSINYEAGLRYEVARYRLEAVGFWNQYTNLTATCDSSNCGDVNQGLQVNAGAARIFGSELFAQAEPRWGLTTIPVAFAYTFTRAEFLSEFMSSDPIFGSVAPGDEVPYVPRHQLSVTVGVERPRWGVGASLLHVASMRDMPGKGDTAGALMTDAMTVVDATGHLNLPYNAQLYLQIRNLLDEMAIVSYRPFGARPNAPRWIQVGARWSF